MAAVIPGAPTGASPESMINRWLWIPGRPFRAVPE